MPFSLVPLVPSVASSVISGMDVSTLGSGMFVSMVGSMGGFVEGTVAGSVVGTVVGAVVAGMVVGIVVAGVGSCA